MCNEPKHVQVFGCTGAVVILTETYATSLLNAGVACGNFASKAGPAVENCIGDAAVSMTIA